MAYNMAVIILSTPKSPMREVFCAMRIVPELASVTCLLFDAQPADLGRVVGLLRRSPPGLAWRSPVAFLAMLFKECGRTSELKRQELDDDILGAECQTKSTLWKEPEKIPGKPLARWPNDFYAATSAMHLCHNNMMFVARAVDFEIAVWKHLLLMITKEPLLMWLRASAGESEWVSIQDEIQFEISHTVDRNAQIECLKERIAVQVNLLDNRIAHHESSQTNLIALLALIFAPASLIASIFSTGIVATNERSWIAYVATTVPVTIMTVIAGLSFLESQKLKLIRNHLLQNQYIDFALKVTEVDKATASGSFQQFCIQ
ncbi:hypothetical protein SLS53_009303 [Cytospora paraplurivora]|uniref:Uncharacterized protein n=1 Tax=Cytospora paraplurivora TaxID=2898453 RepID=A0AAN9YC12_9PEZI